MTEYERSTDEFVSWEEGACVLPYRDMTNVWCQTVDGIDGIEGIRHLDLILTKLAKGHIDE